jgi:ferredoxin
MSAQIEVEMERCEGHGLCEQVAPDIYQLDDEGELVLLAESVSADLVNKAEAGARACPVAAIRVLRSEGA